MPRKHMYRYIQFVFNMPGFRSKGGGLVRLRRDDGEKVLVSNRRYRQLVDEGRCLRSDDPSPLCRPSAEIEARAEAAGLDAPLSCYRRGTLSRDGLVALIKEAEEATR